jgi:hypothetical protein
VLLRLVPLGVVIPRVLLSLGVSTGYQPASLILSCDNHFCTSFPASISAFIVLGSFVYLLLIGLDGDEKSLFRKLPIKGTVDFDAEA